MSTKVKVEELDAPTQERVVNLFKVGFEHACFGDARYIMPSSYKEDADRVVNMAVRPDDVWVVTYPRSGTTWTQEMVWLLKNDLDYATAAKIPLLGRYIFLEVNHILRPEKLCQKETDPAMFQEIESAMPSFEAIANAPSPRYIKTHLAFSLLPTKLLDTAKVVYVARDPRDVAVSYYHLTRLLYVVWCPFFSHLKEAWALRHHENVLFIFYEDMTADLASVAKRVAKFYGKEVTDEQTQKLCEYLDISNFRKNKSVNFSLLPDVSKSNAEPFIRKGKSGGWREHFDEEMASQAQRWLRENLAGTDLRFPHDTS